MLHSLSLIITPGSLMMLSAGLLLQDFLMAEHEASGGGGGN
jgi:hypothetical protein